MTHRPGIEIHRAGDRFVTQADGVESRHCFSFGGHYDPTNTGFGPLVALNDETVQPGHGFATHTHRDIEIITWVVTGGLRHEDSTGAAGIVVPAVAQCLSAGRGVTHTEANADAGSTAAGIPVRFVQMWITPREPGGEPSYQQHVVPPDALAAGWAVLASGPTRRIDPPSVRLSRRDVALYAARLTPGQVRKLPISRHVFAFVVRGDVSLETGETLREGDSVRIRGEADLAVASRTDAELLVWGLAGGAS